MWVVGLGVGLCFGLNLKVYDRIHINYLGFNLMSQTTENNNKEEMKGQQQQDGENKRNYRKTLNLPKTAFPMRANLIQNEPGSLQRWEKMKLYERTRAARSDAGLDNNKGAWSFHDGPPYANGSIHLGHLLNKVLKDFVVRSRTMAGYDVEYTPGWDCHGLPIEHKVMTELHASGAGAKLNELNEDYRRMAVRRECGKSAQKFIKLQMGQMKKLLTLADYADPYLTMKPVYESAVLGVFADLVSQGVVYRDLKPVHWSIANQTALAEAELEYEDVEDVSIFVDYDVNNVEELYRVFGVSEAEVVAAGGNKAPASLMIWTTTPWTLPANLAVAVHPRYKYALVVLGDSGRPVVLAEELVKSVVKLKAGTGDCSNYKVLGTCVGEQLVTVKYDHPFCDRVSPVLVADYVTLEDGTGLVHTAPGHGQEDYQLGLANGLDIYCPVLEDGTFDESVPAWLHGRTVWEANPLVLDCLRKSGNLYFEQKFKHSYPHDWRSKTPVIFRATEQWFIAVNKPTKKSVGGLSLREQALAVTEKDIQFVPEWGRNRMRGMLETRPDWCLSRQRAWGLPIPAFKTADGQVLLTEAVVRAVAKAVGEKGSDIWFTQPVGEILKYYDVQADPDAPEVLKEGGVCGGNEKHGRDARATVAGLEKMYDIFDVWFESGSSWCSVMKDRGRGYPVDLYLEGSDQHRGWFQLSLLCGLGSTGMPPFKALLTHGFTVDKDGRKMSKSLGNTLEVEDLLKEFGADVCRWWVAGLNYENDIKTDHDFFAVAGESYRKVRNTLRFLLSNLDDFKPTTDVQNPDGHCVSLADFPAHSLDAWVLGEYNKLAVKVLAAYKRYDFRAVQNALYDFCNLTLSADYCAAVKDRLYCDAVDSRRRRRTQTAMWELVEGLCRLMAPILPHTADETYRTLWGCDNNKVDVDRCVHLTTYVEAFGVEVARDWPAVMDLRDELLRSIEQAREGKLFDNPLDAEVRVPDADGMLNRFAEQVAVYGEDFCVDLADLLGVSRVVLVVGGEGKGKAEVVSLSEDEDFPRCERSWKRDGTVKMRSDGGYLSDRDAGALGLI